MSEAVEGACCACCAEQLQIFSKMYFIFIYLYSGSAAQMLICRTQCDMFVQPLTDISVNVFPLLALQQQWQQQQQQQW